MNEATRAALRALPSIDALLIDPALAPLLAQHGRPLVREAARATVAAARTAILVGSPPPADWLPALEEELARLLSPTLVSVINATGVVIHTNLGRAPLSAAARQAMAAVGEGYSNLEYDLDAGARGSRYSHAAARLAALTGAEAALVVNNNAAALLLALATLAAGREVLLSRAHLVEIGGGFRIPEIMVQGGARLREVGTTNRTYLADYTGAMGEQAALVLRVHPSNFRLQGFVHQPDLGELVEAAHAQGLLVVDDVGSGALLDTTPYGLAKEPLVQESIAAGADLVLFSGDKLLGGPQAGCLVGRATLIKQLRRHPLARALRVDKSTLAALDATLLAYQQGRAVAELPVWQMIARPLAEVEAAAWGWAATLQGAGIPATVRTGHSAVGGGSLPGETLPTWVLALPSATPERWAAALRAQRPPVIVRIMAGEVLLDPRTVRPAQEAALLAALQATARAE